MARGSAFAVAVAAFVAVIVPVTPTGATPVCTGSNRIACGGRIIPEPATTAGFLTYAEWIDAMRALAREHPDRVRVRTIGRTTGGRPVYTVMVTDFHDPTPLSARTGLFFNGDIHGDERDGTEGFARITEDLATATDAATVDELQHEVLVFTDANPDGWQTGDVPDNILAGNPTGTYTRANSAGHDLNREWPIVGYQNPTTFPMADAEVRAIVAEGRRLTHDEGIRFRYAFDVHGSAGAETPPAAQLMLDVLLDAGQLDLRRSLLATEWAETYMARLAATTNDNVLATIGAATGGHLYTVGDWDTSWDIYGYTVSGGFSDWMADDVTGLGAVGGTIELWINGEPGQENTFLGFNQLVEESNVHSLRVAVASAMDLARHDRVVAVTAPAIAYVTNRVSLSGHSASALAAPARTGPATTNRFFTDLTRQGLPVTALDAQGLGAAALRPYAAVVVAGDAHRDDPAFLAALRDYARGGGTVVLTDAALRDLAGLGILDASRVSSSREYAGFVDTVAGDPLARGIRPRGRQTYEPVPVGYAISNTFSSSTSINTAPAWWVQRSAWEAAGGRTAGTTGDGRTALGEVALGAGKVRILGSLLPDASGAAFHPFGVADYGVTYSGYQLFLNLVGATANLRDGLPASPSPATGSADQPAGVAVAAERAHRLPATGGDTGPGLALGVLALVIGGSGPMRRRRRASPATRRAPTPCSRARRGRRDR